MGNALHYFVIMLRHRYVRGRPLGVNQLVHVCGLGQYKLQQVKKAVEPCPMKAERYGSSNGDVQEDEVLAIADSEFQDSLAMEAQVDELAGEQTWPTEEEVIVEVMQTEHISKLVPCTT
jgi:pre-rRNA-processing protein TSR1